MLTVACLILIIPQAGNPDSYLRLWKVPKLDGFQIDKSVPNRILYRHFQYMRRILIALIF